MQAETMPDLRRATAPSEQSVCAVLVTYHPDFSMVENLRNILAQVQGLVVVDNGSDPNRLGRLRAASQDLGFHLIENGENLGIAKALNRGVRWAKENEFPWVLLFDQDSKTSEGYVPALFETWSSHPKRDKVASVHPRYMHPQLGCRALAPRASDGSLIWCLTSGTLMPSWIFDEIGWFESEFFIDWVDIEYCFRIRKASYLIVESPEAVLLHEPGNPTPSSLFGLRFWPSHHSAKRRYYMSRNRMVVFRRYFLSLPLCTLKAMESAARDTMKCFLGERDRPQKFRNFLLGTWDGLTGKMGMREEL